MKNKFNLKEHANQIAWGLALKKEKDKLQRQLTISLIERPLTTDYTYIDVKEFDCGSANWDGIAYNKITIWLRIKFYVKKLLNATGTIKCNSLDK